jgi:hypothetical protein
MRRKVIIKDEYIMNCFLYDFKKNERLDNFLSKHAIVQQKYYTRHIYEENDKFFYKYIICEKHNEILGVMPFVIFQNNKGKIINSMPFIGYGGIATDYCGEEKREVFEKIISYLLEVAKDEDVLLTTICTALFLNDYSLYSEFLMPDFELKNFYQYIDLSEDVFGNMKSKFRGNLRRNIEKCKKYGVALVESDDPDNLKEWYYNVYLKRLTETKCAIYPYSVFETFLKCFSKDDIKIVYAKLNDVIIGGGIFLNQGLSFDNFMRVIDSDYFYTQAGNYIDYWSIEYAKNNAIQYYNWQSCDEIGSHIFKYKEDWGSMLGHHYYLTKVTGNLETFKNVPLEVIKKEYKGIYVMPYSEFSKLIT